jgi:hypothetical protein
VNDHVAFLLWVAALWALTYVGAALGTAPDPFSQLFVLAPGLVLALPLAYWLVYRGGLDRLRERAE